MPDANESCSLHDRKCVPCEGGVPPLDADRVRELAAETPEWTVADDAESIQRRFKFKNFVESMQFVNAVADIAEAQGHHPDILINWNRVTLTLSTHAAKGLTDNDFIMAARIDRIG